MLLAPLLPHTKQIAFILIQVSPQTGNLLLRHPRWVVRPVNRPLFKGEMVRPTHFSWASSSHRMKISRRSLIVSTSKNRLFQTNCFPTANPTHRSAWPTARLKQNHGSRIYKKPDGRKATRAVAADITTLCHRTR